MLMRMINERGEKLIQGGEKLLEPALESTGKDWT